jgi:hypothetical protein
LLFPAGKALREGPLPMLETETLQHLVRTPGRFARRDAMKPEYERDVLENRFSPKQLEILKNDADLST